jgi:glycyl-tRNA synthetase
VSDIYDKVIELAKRRGFVWPSAEVYGAVAGLIDYGPLGAMMKRRIEAIWRHYYVIREGYYEIECPTVGTESIYIASGHVKGFADKMCQCPHCNEYFRADHLAEACGIHNAGILSKEDLAKAVAPATCPSCGEVFGNVDVFDFNLMFQTTIGPGSQRRGYLRPETAQGMFTDFSRLSRFYRMKLPFGAVQIGKSYRNEISPRQGMIRLREFTQAEAEIFVNPSEKNHPNFSRYADYRVELWAIEQQQKDLPAVEKTMRQAVDEGIIANEYIAYYLALTHELLVTIGIDPARMRFRQHLPDERAHYAIDCWDAEVLSDRFGWVETVGIADRTDYDLRAHAKESGDSMTVFVPFAEARKEKRLRIVADMGTLGPKYRGKAKKIADALAEAAPGPDGADVVVDGETYHIPGDLYTVREEEVEVRGVEVRPHVIEPSYGIDRMIYGVLEHAYDEEMVDGEERRVMHFAPCVAPVQVAVFPLVNKDGLDVMAREITLDLQDGGILADYDDNGAIGRRYRRQDEVGTPFAVTIDYETKEKGTVTLRDRDSMKQVRLPVADVHATLMALVAGRTRFEDLKEA